MTIPLQSASLYDGQEAFVWSDCLLDLYSSQTPRYVNNAEKKLLKDLPLKIGMHNSFQDPSS